MSPASSLAKSFDTLLSFTGVDCKPLANEDVSPVVLYLFGYNRFLLHYNTVMNLKELENQLKK